MKIIITNNNNSNNINNNIIHKNNIIRHTLYIQIESVYQYPTDDTPGTFSYYEY